MDVIEALAIGTTLFFTLAALREWVELGARGARHEGAAGKTSGDPREQSPADGRPLTPNLPSS
ncbi:MAG: hypothetical protein ACE5KX_08420 [Acidimicrobiia bacterium]